MGSGHALTRHLRSKNLVRDLIPAAVEKSIVAFVPDRIHVHYRCKHDATTKVAVLLPTMRTHGSISSAVGSPASRRATKSTTTG